ncbi:glycosyltransferase family 4 protein [Butyrivibrio proteoclasticus]|uniref:glycosyltransferase family 4 protein n=1 Tax=Butyrivibrio proteoclasticus TaxID=43305 RepID=UPI000B2BA8F6|nr:glycosyltransferase family 4 protein [Butyrivibrio proteoclasticus]
MIVQQKDVKGGIAAVTNGYYGSILEQDYNIRYIESYCDKSTFKMIKKAIGAYIEFSKMLKEFKPELIHIHSSFGGSFYRMQPFIYMAKRRGVPIVDHCHGADFDTFYVKASEKKKRRIKKVFGNFSKVIVLSDEWKEKLLNILPEEKLVVIQNYCKPQSEDFVESMVDSRFDKKQVLFLGELGKRKGGYDFASIVEATVKRNPDVSFVFGGSGTKEDEKNIKDSIDERGISSYVLFPGWVRNEEKDKYLRESGIFLLPSYQEGLPMAILDAMAYGLPVISTNVGGIPQLIHQDVSGYIHEPGDAESMGESISRVFEKETFYKELSKNSLKIASEGFGFDVHIGKLEKVYNAILAEKVEGAQQ